MNRYADERYEDEPQRHPFDVFFDVHGYKDGEEPQAMADWLASLSGDRVVGISEEGAVQSEEVSP